MNARDVWPERPRAASGCRRPARTRHPHPGSTTPAGWPAAPCGFARLAQAIRSGQGPDEVNVLAPAELAAGGEPQTLATPLPSPIADSETAAEDEALARPVPVFDRSAVSRSSSVLLG